MPQSLRCPRCNGAVRVTDQAAGRRVKCPHCQQTFLAPGIESAGTNPEEDWLSLEEMASPPNPTSKQPQPPIKLSAGELNENQDSDDEEFVLKVPENARLDELAKTKKPSGSDTGFSRNDEELLKHFAGEDFDEFTTASEPLPSVTQSEKAKGLSGTPGSIKKTDSTRKEKAKRYKSPKQGSKDKVSKTSVAEPVELAQEYRVSCRICGSILHAKASQAGKIVKCSDCHSEVLIPSPPQVKKKQTLDLEQVETFQFESKPEAERRSDPFQKSAEQLLAEAERAEEEESSKAVDFDTPKVTEWLRIILGPFRDPGVIVHLAGLSILGIIPTLIVLKLQMPLLILGLFPGGVVLGLLTVSCGIAILLAAANDEPQVTEWPTLDIFGWLEHLILVGSAAALVALPCWFLSTLILGPHLLAVALTMFSIYLLFPFVLLSMLDMNSVFVPFSSELARSVTKCEEAWGGFYFSSGLLFAGTFLVFSFSSSWSPETCAVISIITAIFTAFLYFGMIGRLAYAIGQIVNAPPREDTVDREKSVEEE